ncbi:hypothetical protein Q7P35_002906 [Cladosporium inversicolor]
MSACSYIQSTPTKQPLLGRNMSNPPLVFISNATGDLDAKSRKTVRRHLLTLNRRKKVSKPPQPRQPPGDSNQASCRKRILGADDDLGCNRTIAEPGPWFVECRTTKLGHEALMRYQSRQPLQNRLGNVITDPFGILAQVACPGIPTFDAFCHWYSMTDVTVTQRSAHFESAAFFWGEALWDVSCKDEALFAALLSLVARKRAEFLGDQDPHRYVQASELISLTRLRQHISANPVNGSTLVSIAGLAMVGALNGDRDSICLHMQAVQRLWPSVRSVENEWLFTVFIDLGIVSCTGQHPYIPHDVHARWAERVKIPMPFEAEEASENALKNTLSFGTIFGQNSQDHFTMFKTLHELRVLWNSDRLDQYPPFATLYTLVYQTCVHHAFVLANANCIGPLGDLGAIVFKLCAWSWAAPFVSSKRGIHEVLLMRALAVLPRPPQRLVSLWKERANVQSLLWVLFALISECSRNRPEDLHYWVKALRTVCDEMGLRTINDFGQALDGFPIANWWRVDALPRFWKLVRLSEDHQLPSESSDYPRANIPTRYRFPSTSPFLRF